MANDDEVIQTRITKAQAEYQPGQRKRELTDDQLETELHLLALLLDRHKNLVHVYSTAGSEYLESVTDNSPELHKSISIHLERTR